MRGIASALCVLLAALHMACGSSTSGSTSTSSSTSSTSSGSAPCATDAGCLNGYACVAGQCMPACSVLAGTCAKCLDAQTKQGCQNIVNAGNGQQCLAENQLLLGFCK